MQIGVTLEVTPFINPDGLVVMDIHQKIDSFKGNVTIQGVGDVPITSSKTPPPKSRSATTTPSCWAAYREHEEREQLRRARSQGHSAARLPCSGATSRIPPVASLIVLIRPTVLPTPEVAALTAKAEQGKMPEVNRMEAETESDEAELINKANLEKKRRK